MKSSDMKKQEKKSVRYNFSKWSYKHHFDWLLLAFITFVIILLVVTISI